MLNATIPIHSKNSPCGEFLRKRYYARFAVFFFATFFVVFFFATFFATFFAAFFFAAIFLCAVSETKVSETMYANYYLQQCST